MADAESDLIALRNLYGGRKDVITPSVFSRLSLERQEKVLDEMFTAAREAAKRRVEVYRKYARIKHSEVMGTALSK